MRRHFVLGVLTGLAIGSVARQLKLQRVTQTRLDEYYVRRAASYHLTDYLFLGQFPRIQMRKLLMDMANPPPGAHVLDFACGTGANFPYLMERIGSSGHLTGTDYSEAMLAEARKLVEKNGWKNVTLVQADAAKMQFEKQFDLVMTTLGLAVIPGWQEAMQRAWDHLKPGGTFGIADICESERWYMKPVNFMSDLIDIFIVADTSRRPWEWLHDKGERYQREDLFLGYFYAATVQKPRQVVAVNGTG